MDSYPNYPSAGQLAPEVVGQDFDGNTVEIAHDGTPKAIVFLAHWCPHCQAEVPRVTEWLEATGGIDGVEMISVASTTNSSRDNYPPSEWLESEGWPVPVILDDAQNTVLLNYGAGGFPYWVFLDAEGRVALRAAGEMPIEALQAFMTAIAS